MNNISYFFWNIIYHFKRKFQQIRTVINWIPVVWNSFDWDYSYSIDVFKHQLERIAKNFESIKNDSYAKNQVSRIRMVLRLMDLVYSEKYALEYEEKISEKYGKSSINFIPINDKKDLFEMTQTLDNKYSEEQIEQIEKERSELFKLSQLKQKRAHKLLWDLVEHNIQNWWS